jgi:hypothetical protein
MTFLAITNKPIYIIYQKLKSQIVLNHKLVFSLRIEPKLYYKLQTGK